MIRQLTTLILGGILGSMVLVGNAEACHKKRCGRAARGLRGSGGVCDACCLRTPAAPCVKTVKTRRTCELCTQGQVLKLHACPSSCHKKTARPPRSPWLARRQSIAPPRSAIRWPRHRLRHSTEFRADVDPPNVMIACPRRAGAVDV